MFRRHWSSLPKDPVFPSTLEGLGYFINEQDEIRSVENPDCYFKYMINRNERINHRQRFHFNLAMENVILERLESEGLEKLALPFGTSFQEPHIPVFASSDLASKRRIVLIVNDTMQALGMIAGRVANGPGGINKGSAVSLVHNIREHLPDAGIVMANVAALHWWPEGGRALCGFQAEAAPLSSMVSYGKRVAESVNRVPGHASDLDHLARVFEMIEKKANSQAKINIFGIEKGAELVQSFLDDESVWGRWGDKLESMVLFGTHRDLSWTHNDELRGFLAKRCRCYSLSIEPLDTPLSGPRGNVDLSIPPLGLPVFSSSETWCSELMAITAQVAALAYFAEIARHEDFTNPDVVPPAEGKSLRNIDDEMKNSWDEVKEEDKPVVKIVDERVLAEQRMWNRWEETGTADADDLGVEGSENEEVKRAAPAA